MMLDRLEALRIGSSEMDFERAVNGCEVETVDGSKLYSLTAGAFRFHTPWELLWKLPESSAYRLESLLRYAGLRYWSIRIKASIHEGHVERVGTALYVVGRYEALGTDWELSDRIRERYEGDPITAGNRPTVMHWYHITSAPSGEGFRFYVTPASQKEELQARRINRKCLLSFRGCDGFCELLPDAARLLKQRHGSFGGCTTVPRSWCELPDDNCRANADRIMRGIQQLSRECDVSPSAQSPQ